MEKIHVIDSHTGGEPTRVVIGGAPELGGGSVAERCEVFRTQHDRFRSAVVNEPRGSDVLVGALLVPPADASCAAGVIFFNNVGVLGMCGHGTIGLIATLAQQGTIAPGAHRIETVVGIVTTTLHDDGSVSVEKYPELAGGASGDDRGPANRAVTGDVAWGGNWFFLIEQHGQQIALANVGRSRILHGACARR
jgi:4-hydroxyproline epimerase